MAILSELFNGFPQLPFNSQEKIQATIDFSVLNGGSGAALGDYIPLAAIPLGRQLIVGEAWVETVEDSAPTTADLALYDAAVDANGKYSLPSSPQNEVVLQSNLDLEANTRTQLLPPETLAEVEQVLALHMDHAAAAAKIHISFVVIDMFPGKTVAVTPAGS